jgi:hypothetical protein
MTGRRLVAAVLGLFVVVSVAHVIVDEATRSVAAPPADTAGDRLVAYYFHGQRRCKTCNAIEAYAKEALETAFPEEWRSGRLEWRTVNFDLEANAHYRERYGLFTSMVVLSDFRDGKERDWRDLDEVWGLVGDKAAFLAYVERETRDFLAEAP